MGRWLIIIGLCIDGLQKPERHVPIEARHPIGAVRKAIPVACKLNHVPQRSDRISAITITTRRIS